MAVILLDCGAATHWRPPESVDGMTTGDPAYGRSGRPTVLEEQCVGACDCGLEEGAAQRRCVTPPLRSQLRAAAVE